MGLSLYIQCTCLKKIAFDWGSIGSQGYHIGYALVLKVDTYLFTVRKFDHFAVACSRGTFLQDAQRCRCQRLLRH